MLLMIPIVSRYLPVLYIIIGNNHIMIIHYYGSYYHHIQILVTISIIKVKHPLLTVTAQWLLLA